jgi:hypothetical protein
VEDLEDPAIRETDEVPGYWKVRQVRHLAAQQGAISVQDVDEGAVCEKRSIVNAWIGPS